MKGEAHVDGGARGNPGPAGYGAVLKVAGQTHTSHEYLGHATNNEAEYRGLIAALELAREHGVNDLTVFTDSQLMQRQLSGAYRVKAANLVPLYLEAQSLASGFTSFRIVHVRREKNREADRLVNQAIDAGINDQ
jgi:ribonuclease HI